MNKAEFSTIAKDSFWNNNPALVQILGLCPLLAVSATVVNALGLGLATTATLTLSNFLVSLVRNFVRPEVRIPVFVLIIAAVVTTIELLMNAYFHDLYKILGIFISLIVTNCVILGRAEAFASKNKPLASAFDGFTMGLGFTSVLVILGSMRELIGSGTLFHNAHLMFGEAGRALSITVIHDYSGFLLAILPPGAFLGLGLLLALKNIIDAKIKARAKTQATVVTPAQDNDAAEGTPA